MVCVVQATNFQQTRELSPDKLRLAVKALILIGLGAYFVYNISSGNLANYINARFAWLSYVAVALFMTLGGFCLYSLLTDRRYQPTAADHLRDQVTLPMLAIVAIPLLLGTLVPSRPLGVEAITGDLRITSAIAARGSLVTKDPLQRNVLDWSRLFTQSRFPTEFNGQEASIIGFVYRQPDFPENTFMAARFTVSCCVADAMPIGLPIQYTGDTPLTDGAWVRVEGAFQAQTFMDQQVPVLHAERVTFVEQPEHPYLYP